MVMIRSLLALLLLLFAGCLDVPSSTLPQTPSDRRAADAGLEAYVDARGPLRCAPLDRVDVISRPADEMPRRCHSDAQSCVYIVQRFVGADPSTLIYVRDDADARTRAALVVHEALHVARVCWVYRGAGGDYVSRLRTGASEECAVHYSADHYHCDGEIWSTIEREAIARWELGQ